MIYDGLGTGVGVPSPTIGLLLPIAIVSTNVKIRAFILKCKLRWAYQRRSYDAVERSCARLLEFDEDNVAALDHLGRMHLNRKEYFAALGYWERLTRLQTTNPLWYRRIASSNFNLGLHEEAMQACRKAMEINTNDPEARRLAARIYLKWGELASAEAIMPLELELEGTLISSIVLARLAYRLGRYQKAEAICMNLLEKNAKNIEALELLGRIYSKQNRYEVALGLWKRLGALRPNDRYINLKLARACYNLGDYITSDIACSRVLTARPDDFEALELKGRLLHRQRNWPEALRLYQQLFDRAPSDLKNATIYIKLLFRLSRESEAMDIIQTLGKKVDENPHSLLGLALLHEELLLPHEARQFLDRAVRSGSQDPGFLLVLIQEYLALQRLETAYYHLGEVRKLDPGSSQLRSISNRIETLLRVTRTDPDELIRNYRDHEPVLITERIIDAMVQQLKPMAASEEHVPGRVVMVSSTLNRGGAERQVVMSLEGLNARMEQVEGLTLFSGDIDSQPDSDQTFLPRLLRSGIRVLELNRPQINPATEKVFKEIVGPGKEYLELLPENIRLRVENLFFQFTQLKSQVVHAWQDNTNIIAGLAAAMAGVPRIILSARSLRPDQKTRLHAINTRHSRQGYLSLLKLPNVILSVNSNAAAQSYSDWLGIDERTIPVIHNGLNFEQMDASAVDVDLAATFQEMGLPADATVLGAVFRLTEEKRPRLWVEVAAQVASKFADIHFVIVGGGAMLEETRLYAAELGLADRFHLPGQSTNVKVWLEHMDLFLLTSRVEGLPNVLIEAQAFGVPVVTTDAGGAVEVILNEQSGWVVKSDDPEAISERIIWCLNHPEWMKEASRSASEQSRSRFDTEQMIDRLLELYGFTEVA